MSDSRNLKAPFFVKHVDPRVPAIHHEIPQASFLDRSAPVAHEKEKRSGVALVMCDDRIICLTYMDAAEKWCGCGRYYYKRAWEASP